MNARIGIVLVLLWTCLVATVVLWVACLAFAWRALRGRTLSARRFRNQVVDFVWGVEP